MTDFITQNWLDITAVGLAAAALVISIQAWHKSRAVYDISRYKISRHVGDSKDAEDLRHEKALRQALQTGNWQILHIYEQPENTLMFVLGRIKK